MSRSYMVYRQTETGLQKLHTFNCKGDWHTSVRSIAEAYFAKHPEIPPGEREQYWVALRYKKRDRWKENEPLQME